MATFPGRDGLARKVRVQGWFLSSPSCKGPPTAGGVPEAERNGISLPRALCLYGALLHKSKGIPPLDSEVLVGMHEQSHTADLAYDELA